MFAALRGANPGELVLAGCCFAAAVACSAASWRTLIGRTVSLGDACARYGTGSLVNTFVPARAGDAVRLGLVRPGPARRAARRRRRRRSGRHGALADRGAACDRRHRGGAPVRAAARARRRRSRNAAARRRLAARLPRLSPRRRAARPAARRRSRLPRMSLRLGGRDDRRAHRRGHAGGRRPRRPAAADGCAARRPRARARRHRPAHTGERRCRRRRRRARVPRARRAVAHRARRGPRAARRRDADGARVRRARRRAVLRSRRAAVTGSSPLVHGADAHERRPGAEDRRDPFQLRARGNDEETLPPATPAGSRRCRCLGSRARGDDASRSQGPRQPARIRNGDADQAPGRDLPGERLLRPLLRHVPDRGEHRRPAVRGGAGHAGGRRADAGDEPSLPRACGTAPT